MAKRPHLSVLDADETFLAEVKASLKQHGGKSHRPRLLQRHLAQGAGRGPGRGDAARLRRAVLQDRGGPRRQARSDLHRLSRPGSGPLGRLAEGPWPSSGRPGSGRPGAASPSRSRTITTLPWTRARWRFSWTRSGFRTSGPATTPGLPISAARTSSRVPGCSPRRPPSP